MIHAEIKTILTLAMESFMSETEPDMFYFEMLSKLTELEKETRGTCETSQ